MTTAPPRRMHLAASAPGAGERAGFASYERLARTAERGLFDFLLVAGDAADGPDALTVLAALAAGTDRLGLAADAAFGEPCELARRLATLDHLSDGRAAWHAHAPAGGHPRAAECVAAARALWDSWTPDGAPRPVAHRGRYFAVEGEFTVERCPQGHPVTVLAGDSPQDRELAASAADVVVLPHTTFDAARARYAEVKGRLAAHGRAHDELKVMLRVALVLDDADGTGAQAPLTGSPAAVAALLTAYVAEGAADGFVLDPYAHGGLDGFVDRVVPLLQDRGAFRRTYTGSTLRSQLGIAAPVWKG
ncbi:MULTISPECIES: LLM class flavin-dependent oxidoreductase [unclassified Streptomyces]|uniref:LLM class flavin-dependent oxidoreductase n=1 Tax=unclassified Streptomyces TaxID=2593676 RepID=UPI002E822F44|nr:LLM class flavin-dependent oxidoreductase [Streptomyces sp. NBC_00523]WUC99370.1 LLM class flavin-dependent oxidoreductase [Streptomyces sp. NBC_00523]